MTGLLPLSRLSSSWHRLVEITRVLPITVAFCALCLASCSTAPAEPSSTLPVETITPAQLGPTSTYTTLTATRVPVTPTATLRPIAPISESDWIRGPADAPIQILLYSDFQCPYCIAFAEVLAEAELLHPNEIQVIYRHFPLVSVHDKATLAAQISEAAGAQGAFWPMHDLLYGKTGEWVQLSPSDFLTWALEQAELLGLNTVQMENELAAGAYAQKINEAYQFARESGILGTPFIFFNGYWFRLDPSLSNLEAAIRLELVAQQQMSSPATYPLDPEAVYIAKLITNLGIIEIQLLPGESPKAVENFLGLAAAGWFDGNPFFEVIPGRLVETGDPSGTGFGGPGYTFADEISPRLTFDVPGLVAMSSIAPDTNGSQFFISLAPLPDLTGTRTIFGRVITGLEFLQGLAAREPITDLLEPPQLSIERVEVEPR